MAVAVLLAPNGSFESPRGRRVSNSGNVVGLGFVSFFSLFCFQVVIFWMTMPPNPVMLECRPHLASIAILTASTLRIIYTSSRQTNIDMLKLQNHLIIQWTGCPSRAVQVLRPLSYWYLRSHTRINRPSPAAQRAHTCRSPSYIPHRLGCLRSSARHCTMPASVAFVSAISGNHSHGSDLEGKCNHPPWVRYKWTAPSAPGPQQAS